MKKILCLFLTLVILLVCFTGCSDEGATSTSSDVSSQTEENFVKPENYASVVLVTINPQFKLYLDAENIVLAVEPVNDDAKTINKKIEFKNQKVDTVVNNLITAANDNGFIKENVVIDFKVAEVVDQKVVATDILNEVKTAATKKATELNIKIEVKGEASSEASNTSSTSSAALTSSSKDQPVNSEQTLSSSSEAKPVSSENKTCKHTKVSKKPVSTGKNIIDSSKLDMLYHNKICNDCKAVIGTEKHTVKSGKCTVCGQSNFALTTKYLITASVSDPNDFCAAKINANGSLDYSLVIQNCWFEAKGEWLDEWHKKIPEAEMLKAIRTKFVMSDSEFEKLKQQGVYYCSLSEQKYSDGYFNCTDPAAGGPGEYSHTLVGYKDNKNGSFSLYYDYLLGGPDVEENERKHQYYYVIEYTYSGASNLEIATIVEEGYSHYEIQGWKPIVESLRIKAIKKLSSLPTLTVVK